MVRKIVVVGHSQLAAVIDSSDAQIVACPDEMPFREAITLATSDGTPEQFVGLLLPWDVVPNCAQIARQLMERSYRVVIFIDDPAVDLNEFQGLPMATPDFSVDDLANLMTQVMGAMVYEAGTSPAGPSDFNDFGNDFGGPEPETIDVGAGLASPGNPWDQPVAEPVAPAPPQPTPSVAPQAPPQAPTPQAPWEAPQEPSQVPPATPVAPPTSNPWDAPAAGNPWDAPVAAPQPPPAAPPAGNPWDAPQSPPQPPQGPSEPSSAPPWETTAPPPFEPPVAPQRPVPPQVPPAAGNPWDAPVTAPQSPPQAPPAAPPAGNPWDAPQSPPQPPQPPSNPMYEPGEPVVESSPWATPVLNNPPPSGPVPDTFGGGYPQAPQRPDPFAPPPTSGRESFDNRSSAYETSRSMSGYSSAPDPGPGQYRPAPRGKTAMVHTFAVPKGGTGKSSLAAVYAAVLALGLRADPNDPSSGPRVLLVDANVQQADSRRIMGLRPQRTILDLARTVYDENSIEAYLTSPTPANPMWLLAGPLNKADADPNLVTPSVYRRATDMLLTKFDHIVIDTPEARIFDPMLADYAMPITDWLIVPVIQNRPVLDGTKEWLQLIQAPRHVGGYAFEASKVRLVMNMARESVGYKTEALSVDLASWEFAGEVAYSDKMAQATNEYRLPLDDKMLVESVRRVIYSVTGNTLFSPNVDMQDKGKGKKKGKGKGAADAAGGAVGFLKKMIS